MGARKIAVWWGLLAASLFGGGTAMGGDSDGDSGSGIRPARERLVEYWLIGGSDRDNDSRRNVKPRQVGDGGWTDFVEERVRPAYQWGLRRFWLHNPFGTVPGEVMQFDQYLDAKEAGLHMLTDDFASAWRPIVDGRFGEPVELIAYMGTANFNDDRLARAKSERDPAAVLATALRCIQPVLLAGASIGADAASTLPDNGPEFDFYKFLEGIGLQVYVEARPRLEAPGWSHFPVASMNDWWLRSDPDRYPSSQRVPNDQLRGGVVRIMNDLRGASSDPADVQESIARVRHALLEGHTVVFRGDGLRAAGVTIDQLVAGIDEQLGVDPNEDSRLADADPKTDAPTSATSAGRRPEVDPGITIEVRRGGTATKPARQAPNTTKPAESSDDTFRPYVRTRTKPGTR
jgi:hypothetical protein